MKNRRLLNESFKNLKKNYLLFVFVCLVIALSGFDFDGTTGGITGKYSDFDISIELEDSNASQSIDQSVFDNEDIFGRTNGVFAGIVNFVNSDDTIEKLYMAVNSLLNNDVISIIIGIIVSIAIMLVFEILVAKPVSVSVYRIVLENRTYKKTKAERLFFLVRTRKWFKVSWVLLVTFVYNILWIFTIVGVFIKKYSYYMVPFILAENPDLSAKEAITLSRKMMNGHKLDCFFRSFLFSIFEYARFIPAVPALLIFREQPVLSIFAFIYSMIFIMLINPLKLTYFAEYYVMIRQQAIENIPEAADILRDKYLYEIADPELRYENYQDIEDTKKLLEQPAILQPGIKGFVADNFGIVLTQNEASEDYENRKIAEYKLTVMGDDVDGDSYPDRLHPAFKDKGFKFVDKMQFDRQYTLTNIVLMFLIVSFCGWLWEVTLHLIQAGEIVNRGTLHGPWLPIYGCGGVLVLMLLTRLRKHPVTTFFVTIILCGILEYGTSVLLEVIYGSRWWDYSGYFMNLNGRICGEGLLIFGVGGVVFIYICAPLLDNLLNRYPHKLMKIICIALIAVFLTDSVYSAGSPNAGEGVVEENKVNK